MFAIISGPKGQKLNGGRRTLHNTTYNLYTSLNIRVTTKEDEIGGSSTTNNKLRGL